MFYGIYFQWLNIYCNKIKKFIPYTLEEDIEQYLKENHECFDRFTFDNIFRFLLKNEASHEEVKDVILFNCSLSVIIFQERIDNDYYKLISVSESISEDLRQLTIDMLMEKSNKFN